MAASTETSSPGEGKSFEEEREEIFAALQELDDEEKTKKIFLLNSKWWRTWTDYTGYNENGLHTEPEGGKPGVISNTEILDSEFPETLSDEAAENIDFVYLTEAAWNLFKTWYGLENPSDEIERYRTPQSLGSHRTIIDVRPVCFKVRHIGSDGKIDPTKDETKLYTRNLLFQTIYEEFRNRYTNEKGNGVVLRISCPFRVIKGAESEVFVIPEDFDQETICEVTKESKCLKKKLVELDLKKGDLLVFEASLNKRSWSSSEHFDATKLHVGSVAEGKDQYDKWYHMQIRGQVEVEAESKTLFKCHWIGFKPNWDEDIDITATTRFAALGTNKNVEIKLLNVKNNKTRGGRTTVRNNQANRRTSAVSSSYTNRSNTTTKRHSYTSHTRKNNTSSSTKRASNTKSYSSGWSNTRGSPTAVGIVGLRNLGNTCFMNSVIQCFNQTPILKDFFVSGEYKAKINRNNILGHKGKVVSSWANLQGEIWDGSFTTVIPSAFKRTIGEFAHQFMGYQQHDAQEFFSFLVDGIHEDLNAISEKPYFEKPEATDGDNLTEVAQTAWQQHKDRNDSIVVDNFGGQQKSRVECPTCGRVSITFDPYTSISLPIPQDVRKNQIITYIPFADGFEFVPTAFGVKINKHAKVGALKNAIIDQLGVNVEDPAVLKISDVYSGKFTKEKKDTDRVSGMYNPTQDDYFVFETRPYNHLANPPTEEHEMDLQYFDLMHKKPGRYDHRFGVPLKLCIDKNCEWDGVSLLNYIYTIVIPYLKEEQKEEIISTAQEVQERVYQYEFDFSTLFEVKWVSKENRRKSQPKAWEELTTENVHTLDEVILQYTKVGEKAYNTRHSMFRTRRQDDSCKQKRSTGLNMAECFDLYTAAEELGEDNYWYCNVCKEHVPATKTMSIWTVPPILVLHLKRFQYSRWSRTKISTLVDFPLENLDVRQWVENGEVSPQDCIYDCYGVSNHSGSLGSGHYTAYVRNLEDSNWYSCNDSQTRTQSGRVASEMSYLLFYKRRNLQVGSGQTDASMQG